MRILSLRDLRGWIGGWSAFGESAGMGGCEGSSRASVDVTTPSELEVAVASR